VFYLGITILAALLVFLSRLPATIRRIRAQREALRPVAPISRLDHLPCIVNTVGVFLTEFTVLGMVTLAVFVGLNAALGAFYRAPDISAGVRQLSGGVIVTIVLVALAFPLLTVGARLARYLLVALVASGLVGWLVITSVGDQWPKVMAFGLFTYAIPALLVLILRMRS